MNLLTQQEQQIIRDALAILDRRIRKKQFMISKPHDAVNFLRLNLELSEREIFSILFLNMQNQVLAYEELFLGTIDQAVVHPREVLKFALYHNAASVILAHNHPSGYAEPSEADRKITDRLISALNLVDIKVLDHIIIGEKSHVSFAQRGLL